VKGDEEEGMTAMILGPVSNLPMSPWDLIAFGSAGLAYAWFRYFFGGHEKTPFPGGRVVILAFATAVLGGLIIEGVWHLLR
jgi:hypothetical protein